MSFIWCYFKWWQHTEILLKSVRLGFPLCKCESSLVPLNGDLKESIVLWLTHTEEGKLDVEKFAHIFENSNRREYATEF